ncbi:hypothetical protein L6E12_12650 [Actinokineospora sp. PR83]|uniref:hypothetical protein n=1 Tax=Actinokineospora sp. PR83 TaxID=2884908 RepID=UPI001F30C538|nr:hypothetical protein [Actinokineospora sp. PR83]MCG8916640.1 hypothetical protein [Actinokineospora sp. PR83]
MDPEAVSAIADEVDELAQALTAAAAYPTPAEGLSVDNFGGLPAAQRVGADFLEMNQQLATSFGYVGQLMTATENALKAAAGLQVDTETQAADTFGRVGGAF